MSRRTMISMSISSSALWLSLHGAALTARADCPGGSESASAVVQPGSSALLNPGGGPGNPIDEAIIDFANGSESDAASVTVCQQVPNPFPGSAAYAALDTVLSTEVSLTDGEFFTRVMIPFTAAEVPTGSGWGPMQVELTYYDADLDMWLLAPLRNTVNSPGYAERLGDSWTSMGEPPVVCGDLGDYGLYWDPDQERGFVWANVDFAGYFAAGLPQWSGDINGGGVDLDDLLFVILNWGSNPPIGTGGDVNFDGVVDIRDLLLVAATLGTSGYILPPADASIHHCIKEIDNSAGDAEWGPGAAGITHFTFDLEVVLNPAGDKWVATTAQARLDDPALSFYQHPAGSGAPPFPFLCPGAPALAFDSYWIDATLEDPCAVQLSGGAGPGPAIQQPAELTALWSAVPGPLLVLPESIPHQIARYTMVVDDPCENCHLRPAIVPEGTGGPNPVLGTITGNSGHAYGLWEMVSFSFDIIDACAADITDDQVVDVNDLIELILAWGDSAVRADINRSGAVDVDDLLALILSWGDCPVLPAESCSDPSCG